MGWGYLYSLYTLPCLHTTIPTPRFCGFVHCHPYIFLHFERTLFALSCEDNTETYTIIVGTFKLIFKTNTTFFVALHNDTHEITAVSFVVRSTVKWSFLVNAVSGMEA